METIEDFISRLHDKFKARVLSHPNPLIKSTFAQKIPKHNFRTPTSLMANPPWYHPPFKTHKTAQNNDHKHNTPPLKSKPPKHPHPGILEECNLHPLAGEKRPGLTSEAKQIQSERPSNQEVAKSENEM
ncbi:hypothetical protein YQE_09938, partial [Dendroctonus ponderosae]